MYNSGKSSTNAKQYCTCIQLQYKEKKSTKIYIKTKVIFSLGPMQPKYENPCLPRWGDG
jgi:hypothetical protein